MEPDENKTEDAPTDGGDATPAADAPAEGGDAPAGDAPAA